jgi:phosphatidylserine decarboxylase
VTGGELTVAAKNGRSYRLEELTKTTLHSADATVVGIRLNFLDVHVNRSRGALCWRRFSSGKTAL